MLRRLVLSVMLIDVCLVVGRVLTFPAVWITPGFQITLFWLSLSFIATAAFVIWFADPKSITNEFGLTAAAGLLSGVILTAHMALEDFAPRIGEDGRLTIAVMLAVFALWFAAGWWAAGARSIIRGTVAGCSAAIISVILAVTFGFAGMYFDVPSSAYVATWPEFVESGSRNPQAFAVSNTLDVGTSHISTALLLGSLLGAAGVFLAMLRKHPLADN